MRLYIAPLLFCTICALPGSAQFTAGHALNVNLPPAPSIGPQTAPSLQGATVEPQTTQLQGATMGTIGPETAPQLQGATMGTIGPETAPQLQGATMGTIAPETAPQLQGATMGTIGPETAPQLQGATMGTIAPETAPQLQGATMGTIGPETAPQLQGATMGTIGPQGLDATVITGINTPGEVRINMLANLEALLNIVTNGVMIVSLLWGGALLISALSCFLKEKSGVKRSLISVAFVGTMFAQGAEWLSALFSALLMRMDMKRAARSQPVIRFWMACFIIKMSLLLPAMVNWLVASARDANLFS